MARFHSFAGEDECPRHVAHCADYLAIHQVAQTDKAGGDRGGNGNVVEYILQNMVKRLNQSEGGGVLESKVFGLLQLQSFVAQGIRLGKLGNLVVEGLSFLRKF